MKIVGVDLGIRKIALSIWQDELLVHTAAFESKAGTREKELMECADWLAVLVDYENPDYVIIEETLVGNNVKYSIKLAQMMGACLLRMAELQQDTLTVNVSTWKREVLGKGNASKDMVRDYLMSYNSVYPELCGWDQDRFDAACIGYYGFIIHRRAVAAFG